MCASMLKYIISIIEIYLDPINFHLLCRGIFLINTSSDTVCTSAVNTLYCNMHGLMTKHEMVRVHSTLHSV